MIIESMRAKAWVKTIISAVPLPLSVTAVAPIGMPLVVTPKAPQSYLIVLSLHRGAINAHALRPIGVYYNVGLCGVLAVQCVRF